MNASSPFNCFHHGMIQMLQLTTSDSRCNLEVMRIKRHRRHSRFLSLCSTAAETFRNRKLRGKCILREK
ncbi:unnamed protein product [Linum tenue]|uniref:Uncharacterized protein n=1 Tax=Linum tenue TaxID=586396 RepID=A0AAV0HRQ4_9ROSI|nr:unnamed protein product [Linum tenue]